MSIGEASIGPQCYGRNSDAVVYVYLRQLGRFADVFHHVCEGVQAKWPLFEPHRSRHCSVGWCAALGARGARIDFR